MVKKASNRHPTPEGGWIIAGEVRGKEEMKRREKSAIGKNTDIGDGGVLEETERERVQVIENLNP